MENKNLVKEKLTVPQAIDKTNSAMKDVVNKIDNLKTDLETKQDKFYLGENKINVAKFNAGYFLQNETGIIPINVTNGDFIQQQKKLLVLLMR